MNYLRQSATPRVTPQGEAIPGSDQTENNAGGFTWTISPMDRLRRFLILGSEGGTYYVKERTLTRQNIDGVRKALDEYGPEAVKEIVTISEDGRASKNDPALYALAIACAHKDDATKRAALDVIPKVARTGTHLFHFVQYVSEQRGWGPSLRKAVAAWYERDDTDGLAYQMIKYRQRDGWTHRDVLRKAHPDAPTNMHKMIYDWCLNEGASEKSPRRELAGAIDPALYPFSIQAYWDAQGAATPYDTAALIHNYGRSLPREAIKTDHMTIDVWRALLDQGMPMTALIRNLPTMTRLGLLTPMGSETIKVVEALTNEAAIKGAKVHPIQVLAALVTYRSGQSARGKATWTPIREIVDALDAAFYVAFGNVPKTGKRHLLALDVSGSMDFGDVTGIPGLTPRVASAAMAMVTANSGDPFQTVAFTSSGSGGWYNRDADALTEMTISPRQRLDDIVNQTNALRMGGTDCALPMLYAIKNNLDVDAFIVYTDSETWAGDIHPMQALQQYRDKSGKNAKLIVVGMTATEFTIADPNDRGSLDVVGFDTSAPAVMSEFVAGNI